MSSLCLQYGVRLLAYGTLAGGLLTDRMLATAEGQGLAEGGSSSGQGKEEWSVAKYRRFLQAAGAGWPELRGLLVLLQGLAERKGCGSLACVAASYVLHQPAVAAVIIGSHLRHTRHVQDNIKVRGRGRGRGGPARA